jgi:hypothetical protein
LNTSQHVFPRLEGKQMSSHNELLTRIPLGFSSPERKLCLVLGVELHISTSLPLYEWHALQNIKKYI